jgi:hypothetical protein
MRLASLAALSASGNRADAEEEDLYWGLRPKYASGTGTQVAPGRRDNACVRTFSHLIFSFGVIKIDSLLGSLSKVVQ